MKYIFLIVLMIIPGFLHAEDDNKREVTFQSGGSFSARVVVPLTMTAVQSNTLLGRFYPGQVVHKTENNKEIMMDFSGESGESILIVSLIRISPATVQIMQMAFDSDDGTISGIAETETYEDETLLQFTMTVQLDSEGKCLLYVSPRLLQAEPDADPEEDVYFNIEEIKYSYNNL